MSRDPQRHEVERLAYFLWLNAGQPSGSAERDWLLAEHAIATGPLKPPSVHQGGV
jgi:hypothetical protein